MGCQLELITRPGTFASKLAGLVLLARAGGVTLHEGCMDEVTLKITKNEALVLFDFLSRFSNEDKLSIQDQAEERALWNLTCVFEKQLAEPFDENWLQII